MSFHLGLLDSESPIDDWFSQHPTYCNYRRLPAPHALNQALIYTNQEVWKKDHAVFEDALHVIKPILEWDRKSEALNPLDLSESAKLRIIPKYFSSQEHKPKVYDMLENIQKDSKSLNDVTVIKSSKIALTTLTLFSRRGARTKGD